MPELFLYLVPGYIFLSLYNFIRYRSAAGDGKFVTSVVISYVLKTIVSEIASLIGGGFTNGFYESVCLIGLAVALAYVVSMATKAEWFHNMLFKIGIDRTTNSSIWLDTLTPYCWIILFLDDKAYYGQFAYCEENTSDPRIALKRFQLIDSKTRDPIPGRDYLNDPNRLALISTKDIREIEIIKNDDSVVDE